MTARLSQQDNENDPLEGRAPRARAEPSNAWASGTSALQTAIFLGVTHDSPAVSTR